MSILGIDIGTTGTKAIAFSKNGEVLSNNYIEYDTVFIKEGWIELDPETVLGSALKVIKNVASEIKKKDPVEVIGISCLGAVVIPVDKKGSFLHNGFTFMDSRSVDSFEDKTGMSGYDLYRITGIPPNPFFTLSKILWLKENRKDIFKDVHKFYSFKELLQIKLGIEPKNDPSMAASTMMFDLENNEWSPEIFNNIGIDIGLFPEIIESDQVIGQVDKKYGDELGLTENVKVIAGGVDTATCPMGVGVCKPGLVSNTIGTFEEVVVATDKLIINKEMMDKGIIFSRHLIPGYFMAQGFPTTGGHVLKWFKNQFCKYEEDFAKKEKSDPYDIILKDIDKGDTNILFLPHLSGSGTPNIDENSRGAFLKISTGSKKEEFARAIIEGLNFEIKLAVDFLQEELGQVEEVHVTGGAVKSDKWMQIKSNIFEKDIVSFKVSEAGVLGISILAAYATGIYPTIDESIKNMASIKNIFKPDKERYAYYRQKYDTYKKLYGILKEVNNI